MPHAHLADARPTWTPTTRAVAFALAATSIAALLSEFYGVSSMRAFVLWVQLPAMVVLLAWAVAARSRGDGRLAHAVFVGLAAGFVAALAYDVFRLPFVYARPLGIDGIVPAMPLFKVFPRFGAMILGQPLEQTAYSLQAQLLGWAYHFSNGATFGVMYLALAGDPARRSPWWGIVFAVGLEIGLLLTPYAQLFGITITPTFIAATLTAHLVFGAVMGLLAKRWWRAA
ncbi:MAG: hypothetical protein ABI780_05070 [Ardenticatenales bacterium]